MQSLLFLQTKPGCSFFSQLTIDNVNRAKISLIIVIIFEVALLIRNIFEHGFSLHYYVIFYIVLLTVSAVSLTLLWWMPNKEQHIRFLDRFIFSYYVFFIFWGGALTVLDQFSYGQVTAYLSNVLVGVLMYHCSMRKFMVMQFIPLVIISFAMYEAQANEDIFLGHMINITVFMVFATIGSRFLYNVAAQNHMQRELLSETNEELEALNTELEYLSMRDELTTLANRRGLYHYMDQHLQVENQQVSAVILDIDAFKHYNDFYGHLEGDHALRMVAKILQQQAGAEKTFVARYGGEEFMFVRFHHDDDNTTVKAFAEQVRQAVFEAQIPHAASPFEAVLSVSLGVSHSHIATEVNMTQLFKEADEALYEAKRSGRNCVRYYEEVTIEI